MAGRNERDAGRAPCHRWPGSSGCHSITWDQHKENMKPGPPKGLDTPYGPPKGLDTIGTPAPGEAPGPAGPPAPGEAPAPPPRVWAPDSGYNDAVGLAKRRYEGTIGELDTAERTTKFEYGYDDPTNPFSRVGEMKRAYLNRGKSITGNLAARGQLYSGYHQAKQASNQRAQSKDAAALRQAYDAALDAIRGRRVRAGVEREEGELGARNESMARQGVS